MCRCLLLFTTFLVLGFSPNLPAQIIPPDSGESKEPDIQIGTHYTLLPIAGYSSDMGFLGGLLMQRINYGNNIEPFLSNISADFTAATHGNLIADLKYERTRTYGTGIRSLIDLTAQRFIQDHYFGIGNQTEFSNEQFEDEYFYFENREFATYYQARKTVLKYGDFGILDVTGSVDFSYLNGISKGEETKFTEDMPRGFGKSWANKAGIGFIADSRDNEFSPNRGFRYEASYEVSTSIVGSDYTYSDLRLDMRHYMKLARSVVLANKLNFQSIQGEAPFWDLAIIGGNQGLRGYHLDRFRGDQSVFHLLELRTWLFSFWSDEIRVGSQAFWDTGRVFSEHDSNDFFNNWKHSYGGGVIFSFFNPDLLLRMDVGFSDETYRVYFGAGYVF